MFNTPSILHDKEFLIIYITQCLGNVADKGKRQRLVLIDEDEEIPDVGDVGHFDSGRFPTCIDSIDNLDSDVLADEEFGGEGINSEEFEGVNFRCETFENSD
ncbi:hypothetical protein LguiB_028207 [Lonicera macranthoides]